MDEGCYGKEQAKHVQSFLKAEKLASNLGLQLGTEGEGFAISDWRDKSGPIRVACVCASIEDAIIWLQGFHYSEAFRMKVEVNND